MKLCVIFFTFFISLTISASGFKVMTFNTMCDFCKGSSFFEFDQRFKSLSKTVLKHSADIIALQEVRSGSDIDKLSQKLPHYTAIYFKNWAFSYADPSILINTKKFNILEQGHFWLGPDPSTINTGWKWALPRQVHWVKLKFENQKFIFMTSHFDNRLENLHGSAMMIKEFVKKASLPIIFAADTNLTVDMREYLILSNKLTNTFDIKKKFEVIGNFQADKDLCYHRKGKQFPQCRVDHVMISKNSPFQVSNYAIDVERSFKKKFNSDHRPVIVEVYITD